MLIYKNKCLLFTITFIISATCSQITQACEEQNGCFHSNGSLFKTSLAPQEERVIKSIEMAPLNSLASLVKEFQYSNSITDLKVTFGYFSSEYDKLEDLRAKGVTFENCIKTLNILALLGDQTSLLIFDNIYDYTQKKYHGAMVQEDMDTLTIPDTNLYKFYFENFSLLSNSIRNLLSQKYREGIYPFERDISKSIKYSSALDLPLTIEKISEKNY